MPISGSNSPNDDKISIKRDATKIGKLTFILLEIFRAIPWALASINILTHNLTEHRSSSID